MKKEIPILFSTPMVKAILAGRKTMTRRINGLQVMNADPDDWQFEWAEPLNQIWTFTKKSSINDESLKNKDFIQTQIKCPYGKPGDILWVRESFAFTQFAFDMSLIAGRGEYGVIGSEIYRADIDNDDWDGKWKPSIHMPKDACRIWLEVTDIRVKRLHDISEDDAIAEGVARDGESMKGGFFDYLKTGAGPYMSAKNSFFSLWQKINGTESWLSNPWVWCVSFKVLSTTGKPAELATASASL